MDTLTLNIGGRLMELDRPKVMGILNVTPDSFYAVSRHEEETAIAKRVEQILEEGGDIIDVGGCSTRPGSVPVEADEEAARLRKGLGVVRSVAPDAVVSLDTFRADVAKMCVEEYGVAIVNDISGGGADSRMFDTVAHLGVPYVLTHNGDYFPDRQTTGDTVEDMLLFFSQKVQELQDRGQKDIVLDPGFGFAKELDANYHILSHLDMLAAFELPVLVGVSRKRMAYQPNGRTADEALNATTALHAFALASGCCHLLRVHDVRACKEVIRTYEKLIDQQ